LKLNKFLLNGILYAGILKKQAVFRIIGEKMRAKQFRSDPETKKILDF